MNSGGVANAIVGGWQVSTIYKYSSALPFYFRVGVLQRARASSARRASPPSSTRIAVFAQDKGSFDPAKGPLFNKDAFEPVERVQLLLRHAATAWKTASAGSRTRTRTCRS